MIKNCYMPGLVQVFPKYKMVDKNLVLQQAKHAYRTECIAKICRSTYIRKLCIRKWKFGYD